MKNEGYPRPGTGLILTGTVLLLLSLGRSISGMTLGPYTNVFEFGCCAAGFGLCFWGWSDLKKEKVKFPELTWTNFLRYEIVVWAFITFLAIFVAVTTPEEQEIVARSLLEIFDLIGKVRRTP
jgi:hypothetical protein